MKNYPSVGFGIICGMAQFLVACGGAATGLDADSASVERRQQEGRGFQGRGFQGRGFQGTETSSTTVQEIRIGGAVVGDLHLDGTLLRGSLASGAIAGTDFIGAEVTELAEGGSVHTATITNVEVDAQDPSGEIYLYTLTAYNAASGAVENICGLDPFGQRHATAVYGTWDGSGAHVASTTQFMFACTSGVVAKCMRWGYKPWKTVSGTSLAPYLQSCTRMARADYCGDGVSHTQDGTEIDLYDRLGIQQKSPFNLLSPMVFDAAWTPNGAYCMTKDRWLELLSLVTVTTTCKSKFLSLFPLLQASPVDPLDLCAAKRSDLTANDVHMDNRSGINVSLL
jgi:hypothetical protein